MESFNISIDLKITLPPVDSCRKSSTGGCMDFKSSSPHKRDKDMFLIWHNRFGMVVRTLGMRLTIRMTDAFVAMTFTWRTVRFKYWVKSWKTKASGLINSERWQANSCPLLNDSWISACITQSTFCHWIMQKVANETGFGSRQLGQN